MTEPTLRLWQIKASGTSKPASIGHSVYRNGNLTHNVAAFTIVAAIRAAEQVFSERWEDVLVVSANHRGTVDLVAE